MYYDESFSISLLLGFLVLAACQSIETEQIPTELDDTTDPTVTTGVITEVVTLEPSGTPIICDGEPGNVSVQVDAMTEMEVRVQIVGLQGGETPTLVFNRQNAPERGLVQISTTPLATAAPDSVYTYFQPNFPFTEGETSHWELQVIHDAGVTCTEFTLTPTKEASPTVAVQETIAAAPQTYVSEDFNFQFAVPDGYVVLEPEHPDALLVVSLHEASVLTDPRSHKPEIFVTVHQNQEGLSVEEWFERHTADTLTDGYPVYVGAQNIQAESIAERAAISFEDMTFSHAYVTLVESNGYILATGYVPVDYPGLTEDFERVLDSLTFQD